MFEKTVKYIKELYSTNDFIPLHEPRFIGDEINNLKECIDSTFVSSVGQFVDKFETLVAGYCGSKFAVVTVNGTEALHLSLKLLDVSLGDEIITQPLTFIATCNAIKYVGCNPVFVDVDRNTLGLSPSKLEEFLSQNVEVRDNGRSYNKITGNKIAACIPMHTFGHPVELSKIISLCDKFNIPVIEDSAESLGSKYNNKQTGTFGKLGILSFNGNKIITTGGGGMILTDDEILAKRAKHLSTQAKVSHPWDFIHDEIGYNFRMPNLNASLGCAQIQNLDLFINKKRWLASMYNDFFISLGIQFFNEPKGCESNYWLNAIICNDINERNLFLKYTNDNNVMTRPIWKLMNELPMFSNCISGDLSNSIWLSERIVNIPSSVIL